MLPHIISLLHQRKIVNPFIIVHGTGTDTKRANIVQSCQEICGFFAYHDVLEIRDYSKFLGKTHGIKVANIKSETSELLLKEHKYEDK